jgi:hypothetical protein
VTFIVEESIAQLPTPAGAPEVHYHTKPAPDLIMSTVYEGTPSRV